MKAYFQTEKYKRYCFAIARRARKRRRQRKVSIRILRQVLLGKDTNSASRIRDFADYKLHVVAPVDCCFLTNIEEVTTFINKLEEHRAARSRVFVVLKKVEKFDYAAISVLLSVMSTFKLERTGFNGDFPANREARKLIVESGFFDHINRKRSEKEEDLGYIRGKDNQIFTHLNTNVVPELGLPILEQASTTVCGEKKANGGLHSVLMELMQNTNNHAASGIKGEKHWWLSVNHNAVNKLVSFSFIDHGVGVLTSLDRKPPSSRWHRAVQNAAKTFGIESNENFIEALLSGKIHQTVTKKSYRGKGLPNIKRMLDFNKIGNLQIITNNVYANVAKKEYRLLNQDFKGTFFYWELSSENEFKPWTIIS